MSGLVKRLLACDGINSGDPDCCCQEAAKEIKHLQAALRWVGDNSSDPFVVVKVDEVLRSDE